jgi:hypothetical protein
LGFICIGISFNSTFGWTGLAIPSGLINHKSLSTRGTQERKEAGTDLTQNLPNGCADFQKKAVLEVSPRQLVSIADASAGSKNRGLIMIRKIPTVALLISALAIAGQAEAGGRGHGGWEGPAVFGAIVGSAIIGSAIISRDRPVYVEQPVYVQPQPVYVQPPPVYYQPAPVYVQQPIYYRPAPIYYGPPRVYGPPRGYYGHPHGYYRGDRW